MNEKRKLTDNELEKLYEEIVDEESETTSPQVVGARRVLSLLDRASPVEYGPIETTRDQETAPISPADDLDLLPLPEKIGRFEIRENIGQGGFGVVFRAYDPNLDREVALKVPRTLAALAPESQQRFSREGKAVASLSHPNIVPVFDSGNVGPICYMASQLVSGKSLAQWLKENSDHVTPKLAAQITGTLAEAVTHAHQRGILHRDIKPENILIDDQNQSGEFTSRIRLTDFGLAKNANGVENQTLTGEMVGTPAYMSPEQVSNLQLVGPASDVYGLGAVLYELLAGKPPFHRETIFETVSDVKSKPAPSIRKQRTSIPADLEAICLKCLEKNPNARYETAAALQADLQRFVNGEPVAARTIGPVRKTIRWSIRNRLATALLVLATLSTVTITSLFVRSEQLRVLSETKTVKLNQSADDLKKTSNQLRDTIQNLFINVAQSPEIMTPGNVALRQRLFGEANKAFKQIVSAPFEDEEFENSKRNSKLNFAILSHSLGKVETAKTIVDELAAELASVLPDCENLDVKRKLAIEFVDTLLLKLQLAATNDKSEKEQQFLVDEILHFLEAELIAFEDNKSKITKAMAFGKLATNRMMSSSTQALELAEKSRTIWNSLSGNIEFDRKTINGFIEIYHELILASSYAEDRDNGLGLCEEFFTIINEIPKDTDLLYPMAEFHLAQIYRFNAFMLRDLDTRLAIEKSKRAFDLANELALNHPLVLSFSESVTSQAYNFGLMNYINKDYSVAEEIFTENVLRCETLIERYDEHSRTARMNLVNSLTMLGILQKKKEDWEQVITTTEKSRALLKDQLKTGRTDFIVRDAAMNSTIGIAHSRLGEHELAQAKIADSVATLFEVLKNDPQNGQANRFLANDLSKAIQIGLRAGNFPSARLCLDKLIAHTGNFHVTLLPFAIALEIVNDNLVLAEEHLNRYAKESSKLDSEQLKFDAYLLGFSIMAIDGGTNPEGLQQIRGKIVDVITKNLSLWLDASEENVSQFSEQILHHPDFAPVSTQPQIRQLAE